MSTAPPPAHIASRLMLMSKELRGEAERHKGTLHDQLCRASRQLTYAYPKAFSPDPDQRAEARAMVDGAVDYLVTVITHRTEHELAKGNLP